MINKLNEFLEESDHFIVGKRNVVKVCISAILVGGHILLEDIPGVGKTLLAKYLAKTLGLKLGRIQFTNDLLPSDVIGINIFNPENQSFIIQKGPIFNELVLADEINRASPRTQSALLQAMEEKLVSIDNQTFELNKPFCVVATQNPYEQVGVNSLPESQLERFLIRIKIGHPERKHEMNLLQTANRHEMIENLNSFITKDGLLELVKNVNKIHVDEKVQNYIIDILEFTRNSSDLKDLSPRTGLDIQKMAKSWAFLEGRDYVIPEDIKLITPHIVSHRLFGMELNVEHALDKVKNTILCNIKIP